MSPPNPIAVIKRDHTGQEQWRYEGVVVERDASHVLIEARFDREKVDLGYVVFYRGDRFLEHYYSDRWYNVFEVHADDDDRLKGWYCNFTRPARIQADAIRYDDLALDLWVYPDRRTLILDRDDFDALPIDEAERRAVLAGLEELLRKVQSGHPPFHGAAR
jgi:protein associated with RNAse G/E